MGGSVSLTFEAPPEKDELEGLTPRSQDKVRLMRAAYDGNLDLVTSLLQTGIDPDCKLMQKGNNTPLNFACRGGHAAVVRYLFEQKAGVDSRNDFAETPLMLASNRSRSDVCKLLLELGADVH